MHCGCHERISILGWTFPLRDFINFHGVFVYPCVFFFVLLYKSEGCAFVMSCMTHNLM